MSSHAPIAKMTRLMTPVGVLVVDDQPAVREGLARLITSAPLALRYVGSAATGAETLSAAARLHPEVVVLDVDLAGEDGLALIPQFTPSASVLVLTSHGDPATRARAARLGARTLIEKHKPAAELLDSISDIARLQRWGEKTPEEQGTNTPSQWLHPLWQPDCNFLKVKAMNSTASGFADESGVTSIEYGLLAALIAVTIIGGVSATGNSLTGLYDYWSAAVIAAL